MNAIAAFVDPAHHDLERRIRRWSRTVLRPRAESASDDEARGDARTIAPLLGEAGWLEPIRAQDLRALCVVRETVASDSPLADAVIAIQGLVSTPLLMASSSGA